MKTCIVTPDLVGPIKNGGIGTHSLFLSKFLRTELGHDVTILYTLRLKRPQQKWREIYRRQWNLTLVDLADVTPAKQPPERFAFGGLARSRLIYDWLKTQSFDRVYFQDWRADGFVAIQAKRTGQAFAHTQLSVTLHGPTAWSRHGMQSYSDAWTDDLAQDYMERYCAEHADAVIAPSQYMLDWATNQGWQLAPPRVLPLLVEVPPAGPAVPPDGRHLIFFGRLETRKGLELFLRALTHLAPHWRARDTRLRVTFLGRPHLVHDQPADEVIRAALEPLRDCYEYQLETACGQPEALQFLINHPTALVVIPSLVDNSPYAVIECLHLQVNFIAAAVGGIPELVADSDCLFAPTVPALCAKLRERWQSPAPPPRPRHTLTAARAAWRQFHEAAPVPPPPRQEPLVTVCMPHHNHGRYLPQTLAALAAQTYPRLEVIVVDDGSTDAASQQVFQTMERQSAGGRRFLRQAQTGPAAARNLAAQHATGEWLIFVDADNLPTPAMVERLVHGCLTAGVDCLTCHHLAFRDAVGQWAYRVNSLGPCLELAMYENVLGDANLIVRRAVFEKLGGFCGDHEAGYEDWEFLLRLIAHHYTLDVIPEVLFYYRHQPAGRARTVNRYLSHLRALHPVLQKLDPWQQRFLENAIGAHHRHRRPPPRPAKSVWEKLRPSRRGQ